MKARLNRKLPPNASKGQKHLAEILDQIFRSGGCDMTIVYEQPLAKLSDPEIVDEYEVNGMTVDFYIKELSMAIEFQGIQHYQSSSLYGNSTARDTRKRRFLEDIGVILKEIPHTMGDEFTEEQIRECLGL